MICNTFSLLFSWSSLEHICKGVLIEKKMCERERAKHIDQNMHADAPASRAQKWGEVVLPYPRRLSRRRRGRRAKRGVGGSEEEEEEPGVTE